MYIAAFFYSVIFLFSIIVTFYVHPYFYVPQILFNWKDHGVRFLHTIDDQSWWWLASVKVTASMFMANWLLYIFQVQVVQAMFLLVSHLTNDK